MYLNTKKLQKNYHLNLKYFNLNLQKIDLRKNISRSPT